LTYAYYSKVSSRFDIVENVYSEEVPIEQFIGAHNILDEL
jgi:hypothetical protein